MKYYKFQPLLKTLIWGTESWQISGVEGNETPTEDGELLNQLLREHKERLVGKANYERFGDEFPLLVKFIDAKRDLSIQVHPDNATARRQGKKHGKSEMWYIMESAPGAKLYSGLKHALTPDKYKAMVADDTICDALAQYPVSEGDCFYIPGGRIHSIGAGCYLAEIQQTSDVTYRIYDYNRRDKDGQLRQLHTHEAAECIDFTVLDDYRQSYTPHKDQGVELVACRYFNTAVYDLTEPMTINYTELDSFVILMGLKGEGMLTIDGEATSFGKGQTVLIPATAHEVRTTGTMKFLETYVLS